MVRSKVSLQKMKNHFVKAPYTNWYLHSNRNFLRRLLGKKMEIIITTPLDRTTSYFFFFFSYKKWEHTIQTSNGQDKALSSIILLLIGTADVKRDTQMLCSKTSWRFLRDAAISRNSSGTAASINRSSDIDIADDAPGWICLWLMHVANACG